MTTTRLSDPERWTDRRPGGGAAEDVMGAALRRAGAATVPSEALLARVEAGVSPGSVVGAPQRWRVTFAAIAGLLAISGTVGAARGPLRAWASRHGLVAASPVTPQAVTAPRARPRLQARASVAPPEVAPAPELAPEPEVAAVRRARAAAPHVAAALAPRAGVEPPRVHAPAVEVPQAAVEEARILRRVFGGLRSGAVGGVEALAVLDDYDQRFSSGLLRPEARLARVEALLRLGRRSAALALLDSWNEVGLDLTRDARTARGELRAEAGRCDEAAADFSAVLAAAGAGADALGGRALYGRASCALRAGDEAAAVAALTLYLMEHASGPQGAQAREALARLNARTASP